MHLNVLPFGFFHLTKKMLILPFLKLTRGNKIVGAHFFHGRFWPKLVEAHFFGLTCQLNSIFPSLLLLNLTLLEACLTTKLQQCLCNFVPLLLLNFPSLGILSWSLKKLILATMIMSVSPPACYVTMILACLRTGHCMFFTGMLSMLLLGRFTAPRRQTRYVVIFSLLQLFWVGVLSDQMGLGGMCRLLLLHRQLTLPYCQQ